MVHPKFVKRCCLIFVLMGLLGFFLVACQTDSRDSELANLEHAILEIGEQCENSIVVIDTRINGKQSDPEDNCECTGRIGSGFVYRNDGYIITTDGVLQDAKDYIVITQNGQSYHAELVGCDFETNLAVLFVKELQANPIPLPQEDTPNGCIGIMLGNTFYSNGLACSMGLVNQTWITGGDFLDHHLLSIHVSAPEVNSGTPVVDARGQLVGVAEGHLADKECIWTLIPASTIRSVADRLIARGDIPRGWFGVIADQRCQNDSIADLLHQWKGNGAVITDVIPESPAAKCNITPGDVVVKINQTEISGSNDLRRAITAIEPGSSVRVEVVRNGKTLTLETELEKLVVKSDRVRRYPGRTV